MTDVVQPPPAPKPPSTGIPLSTTASGTGAAAAITMLFIWWQEGFPKDQLPVIAPFVGSAGAVVLHAAGKFLKAAFNKYFPNA